MQTKVTTAQHLSEQITSRKKLVLQKRAVIKKKIASLQKRLISNKARSANS